MFVRSSISTYIRWWVGYSWWDFIRRRRRTKNLWVNFKKGKKKIEIAQEVFFVKLHVSSHAVIDNMMWTTSYCGYISHHFMLRLAFPSPRAVSSLFVIDDLCCDEHVTAFVVHLPLQIPFYFLFFSTLSQHVIWYIIIFSHVVLSIFILNFPTLALPYLV